MKNKLEAEAVCSYVFLDNDAYAFHEYMDMNWKILHGQERIDSLVISQVFAS